MTAVAYDAVKKMQQRAPNFTPSLAIVLGSGLGGFAEEIEKAVVIPYEELPGFHKPSVEGHGGKLFLGYVDGVPVACMQGRAHYYEGVSHDVFKVMVRSLKLLGCDTWLATNAAGSLREDIQPGSLLLVKDHINFQFNSALVGDNDDDFGPRFFSLEDAYDPALRQQFKDLANTLNIPLKEGVYVGVVGPCFETPAEINAFRILGADVVGMSTIPQVLVARHCGMRVAVISAVTNLAAGLSQQPLSHEGTLTGAQLTTDAMTALVRAFIKNTVNA